MHQNEATRSSYAEHRGHVFMYTYRGVGVSYEALTDPMSKFRPSTSLAVEDFNSLR